ncbi:MAG: hypothetical protein GEU73_07545 [Chloroflexi bacterium]|nr:hypothetical protein [Chloroflexota bacterium]
MAGIDQPTNAGAAGPTRPIPSRPESMRPGGGDRREGVAHGPRVVLLLSGAIGVAICAQAVLAGSPYAVDGVLLYALALLLFRAGLPSGKAGSNESANTSADRVGESVGAHPQHARPLALFLLKEGLSRLRPWAALRIPTVLLLAGGAWVAFGGNQFTLVNVALWLSSLALFLADCWELPVGSASGFVLAAVGRTRSVLRIRRPDGPGRHDWVRRRPVPCGSPTALLIALIVLAGALFRFSELDRIPAEMTSDHAEKLLDVWDVLHGDRPIFFVRNTGREAFHFYLAAATVAVLQLPVDHLALKVGTSAFGVFALPWMYLLGKELYNRQVGLMAAALMAVSFWHVAIVRVGLRFPFAPAFAAPVLYFLVRAFKYNRRNDWLLCGLFTGLALHTYTPTRVLPLLLAGLVGLKLLLDWWTVRKGRAEPGDGDQPALRETSAMNPRFWLNAFLGGAAALLVFLPLGRFMVDHPQEFWFRALSRATDAERDLPANWVMTFLDNVKNALLMFNYRGDVVSVNTVPGSPTLDTVSGALFVLGAAYILWRLIRYGDRASIYLLTAVFVLLLPSTTSIAFPDENPSVVRAGGVIPVVFIIAAWPAVLWAARVRALFAHWPRLARWGAPVAVLPLGLLLLAAGILSYDWYFVRYDAQYREATWNTREMGSVVRAFVGTGGDLQNVYHVPYPHWADTRNIGIKAGSPTWNNALPLDTPAGRERLRELPRDPASKLFLVSPRDEDALRLLDDTFPDGQRRRYASSVDGKDFWVFLAPSSSLWQRMNW